MLSPAPNDLNRSRGLIADWRLVHRYVFVSLILHLVWEVAQLPFYTIWSEPSHVQAFAVIHCTIGDAMIAAATLLAAALAVGLRHWRRRTHALQLLILAFGIGYTIYSEWLNVYVRANWAYAPRMPILPLVGIGLTPLLQWVVVPTLALRITFGGVLMRDPGAASVSQASDGYERRAHTSPDTT
jgi:hypothetical protein